MPKVCLTKELNDDLYNTPSQTINSTQGPGVAQFVSSNGQADIYIGFRQDGYRYYENISALYVPSDSTSRRRRRSIEDEKFRNTYPAPPPVICSDSGRQTPIDFSPDNDKSIAIRVNSCFWYSSYPQVEKKYKTSLIAYPDLMNMMVETVFMYITLENSKRNDKQWSVSHGKSTGNGNFGGDRTP